MKKFLSACIILISASQFAFSQKVVIGPAADPKTVQTGFTREKFDPLRNPMADLAAAVITAAKERKRIILDVGGEWCGWCVYMDKFFYQNPKLDKLRNDNYVWVKVNMSPENENTAFLAPFPVPTGYPHLYVLDETGKMIHSQDTASLESGKSYDIAIFTAFLKKWSPVSNRHINKGKAQ